MQLGHGRRGAVLPNLCLRKVEVSSKIAQRHRHRVLHRDRVHTGEDAVLGCAQGEASAA